MAKKKKVTKRKGRDLMQGKIRLSEDLVIETKLRLCGILWLEEKYDLSLEQLSEKIGAGGLQDFANLLTALAIGTYPDEPVEDLQRRIGQLELAGLSDITSEVAGLFQVSVKNSKRPAKKPVTGNLAE